MKKLFALCVCASGAMFAGGFKLNEHSLNSIALSSAYVAGANGADSSYYNPANMGFGKFSDKHEIEVSTTWIHVPSFDFTTDFTKIKNQTGRDQGTQVSCKPVAGWDGLFGSVTCSLVDSFAPKVEAGPASAKGHANATNFIYPEIFYKSPTFWGGFNIGLSVTAPSGMTMDWDGVGGEFLDYSFIAMVEVNPSISYKLGNWLGVAVGGRAVYGMGDFANTLNVPYVATMQQGLPGSHATVTTKGTSTVDQVSSTNGIGFGYNVALTLKPLAFWTDSLVISATYRSPVHIDFKGELSAIAITGKRDNPIVRAQMDADLILSTDIPPVLQVGIAQRLGRFLIEAVYERNFWSYGDKFEFQYQNQRFSNISGSMASQMGSTDEARAKFMENMMSGADYDSVAIGRGWKDTNSYRIGVTYDVTQKLKAMASFAYDETPVPKDGFGIPDANGYMMGVGVRYSMFKDTIDLGAAYSMTLKDNRESYIQSDSGLGKLQLVNVSMACRF
ncbi:outer membrane protein transport protein [uncultured Helicobacter sp.]|uniref:OmpP1/FadL family transporter n=1 Tax=uncultured Helicobacter sp. TaxID=175537 RepID=UPI00262E5303|nr:outer membrane protein transport protein [uncultured Helicobacter sp.]